MWTAPLSPGAALLPCPTVFPLSSSSEAFRFSPRFSSAFGGDPSTALLSGNKTLSQLCSLSRHWLGSEVEEGGEEEKGRSFLPPPLANTACKQRVVGCCLTLPSPPLPAVTTVLWRLLRDLPQAAPQ